MLQLTHGEAQKVVNAVAWNTPPLNSVSEEHLKAAEEMGLITQEHNVPFTRYVETEKAESLLK